MSKNAGFLSATMILRLQQMDNALRAAGFLAPSSPLLTECEEFVYIVIHARGEDYQGGASGRTVSTQMPKVTIPQNIKKDEPK